MFQLFASILASQFIAPTLFLNWPDFAKLMVEKITHEESEWYTPPPVDKEFMDICGLTDEDCQPYRIPARLIISVKSRHGRGDITINKENSDIITLGVRRPNNSGSGSAEIGMFLFGLPSLIITSPLLIINHLLWSGWEKMMGMERHAWSVWIRIKDQLDPLNYIVVEKAFKKYNGKDYGR